MTGVEAIAELFAGPGARDYLGEAVTIGEHMRQAGALVEEAGAAPPLVAAALLHDVGHLRSETDRQHGTGGARWLGRWFGEAVTEPVRCTSRRSGTCAPPSPATSGGSRRSRSGPWRCRAAR